MKNINFGLGLNSHLFSLILFSHPNKIDLFHYRGNFYWEEIFHLLFSSKLGIFVLIEPTIGRPYKKLSEGSFRIWKEYLFENLPKA
jgi:hypothetical protein